MEIRPRGPSGPSRAGAGGVAVMLAALALMATACSATPSGAGVANLGSTSTSTTTTTTAATSGSGDRPSSGGTGGRKSLLAFSECMRKHGITDFPDPNGQGNIEIHGSPTGDLNPSSSSFQAAQKACRADMPGANPTPAERQQQLARALKLAQCMHRHGITDFPEPNSSGAFQIRAGPGSDLDPSSPKFQAAQKACQGARGGPGGKAAHGGISISITGRAPGSGSSSAPG